MSWLKSVALGVSVVALLLLGGTAYAQTGVGEVDVPRGPNIQGISEEEAAPGEAALPFTGADLTLFAAIGLGAIGAGMLIIRSARVRRQES